MSLRTLKSGILVFGSLLLLGSLFLLGSNRADSLASLTFPSPSGQINAKITDYIDRSDKRQWTEIFVEGHRVAIIENGSLIDSLDSNVLIWKDENTLIVNWNPSREFKIDNETVKRVSPNLSIKFQ